MLSRLFSRRTATALGIAVPKAVMLDAQTLELLAELPTGGNRGDVVAGADGVWFSSHEQRRLSHVSPDGEERLRVELPARPLAIALDGDHPVVLCQQDRLVRVDPVEGRILDDVAAPPFAGAIAAGAGQVWLEANEMQRSGLQVRLVQLDPSTLAVARELDLGVSLYSGNLTISDGVVSILHEESPGSMGYASFDAVTAAPAPTPEHLLRPTGIAERDGMRWFTRDGAIKRVDLATGEELASERLPAPRIGRTIHAHDRIWAITYPRPATPDNQNV